VADALFHAVGERERFALHTATARGTGVA